MRLRSVVVCAFVMLLAGNAVAQRTRKHIEDLTPVELDALADAFQHLKDLPSSDPNYVKWADIHGVSGATSGCEHNSELLWPWHRAYLLAFEDALRASDPPKTSNVTIPYWDWTEPPSGSRYPKAFETIAALQPVTCDATKDSCSPPVANCRKICPNTAPPLSPLLMGTIQATPTWRDYGGGLQGEGIKGALEKQAHDFIHGTYINGLNRNVVRAARDPLFWAHHSYMDKLWSEWQDKHKGAAYDPVCKTCPINFLPGKTVSDYLDISILGYSYQPRLASPAPMLMARAVKAAPLTGLALPKAEKVVEVPLNLPALDNVANAKLIFREVTVPTDASYLVKVYLRPAGTSPSSRMEADGLTMFSMWESDPEHAGHVPKTTVTLDVTTRLHELTRGREKTKWVVDAEILRTDDSGVTTPVTPGKAFQWKSIDIETVVSSPSTIR